MQLLWKEAAAQGGSDVSARRDDGIINVVVLLNLRTNESRYGPTRELPLLPYKGQHHFFRNDNSAKIGYV
jgi:hypothetical protein